MSHSVKQSYQYGLIQLTVVCETESRITKQVVSVRWNRSREVEALALKWVITKDRDHEHRNYCTLKQSDFPTDFSVHLQLHYQSVTVITLHNNAPIRNGFAH
jgi:hypothetical protein